MILIPEQIHNRLIHVQILHSKRGAIMNHSVRVLEQRDVFAVLNMTAPFFLPLCEITVRLFVAPILVQSESKGRMRLENKEYAILILVPHFQHEITIIQKSGIADPFLVHIRYRMMRRENDPFPSIPDRPDIR